MISAICLGLLWWTLMLTANLAMAGDEDLTSSVYLVFDPETGEFITKEDQDRTAQDHEALEPAPPAPGHSSENVPADSPERSSTAAIAIGVALLLTVLVWTSIRRHNSSKL